MEYKQIKEKDVYIKERKLFLLAYFNKNFANKELLVDIEKSCKDYYNDFYNAINNFNEIKFKENNIYFIHNNIYADIQDGIEYDVLVFNNFKTKEKIILNCKSKILSFIFKFKCIPIGQSTHEHSGICLVHFFDDIPQIIYNLTEIKNKNPWSYENEIFLCSHETLKINNKI